MQARNNPWIRQSPMPPPGGSGRLLRWFCWACAAWLAIFTPFSIIGAGHLLATTEQASAVVLARDDPAGAPEPVPLELPLVPTGSRIERKALRFTTRSGEEVVVASALHGLPSRSVSPGSEVTIRYDPTAPTRALSFQNASDIWSGILLDLVALWILLPTLLRLARGTDWRRGNVAWPLWPWRGLR